MSAAEPTAEPASVTVEAIKPKYTKEQEDAVLEWAEKSGLMARAKKLNDRRCRDLGLTLGLREEYPDPLPEPFETIRAIWRCIFRRPKR